VEIRGLGEDYYSVLRTPIVIEAIIHNGQVEVQVPIPESWEGQTVKIVPLTPDDPLPDLDRRLEELHAMGPMEFDEDERRIVERELEELNRQSTIE
jgi:hypothetical protein